MLNFLPPTPYGMVCMIPDETDLSLNPPFRNKLRTDGEYYYDETGAKRAADEYRPAVEQALRAAASRLPVVVEGEVASSVVRLDKNHVRVALFDSGYLDPADREAVVALQGLKAKWCRDILAGDALGIEGGKIRLTVPMGSMRILDIEHE
ncbi:MAG: Lambda-carrageenase precursor [candidate division BRC1 bacterium ADurb.BinA364]|nr:MAG: Lambda-carrageenase precursor [candidate division BRC1 bacterium ADurb.BinA364]